MSIIYSAIMAFLALSMFFLRRDQKLALLWFSMMCLVAFPQFKEISSILNIPTCYLLSEMVNITRSWRKFVPSWLSKILILMVAATIVLYFTSPHYEGIKGAVVMAEEELVKKYLFIIYSLICFSGFHSLKSLLNCTFVSIIVLTFFGAVEYVLGHPVFLEYIFKDRDVTAAIERILSINSGNIERYRVHSMFTFAFDYGYICLLSLLLAWYGLDKKIISKGKCWAIIVCGLYGIVVCSCRTVYYCTIVASFIYIMQAYSLKRSWMVAFSISVVGTLAFFIFPEFQRLANLLLSVFDSNSNFGGSSLEMRNNQFEAVLYFMQDNLIFGNGKRYFILDLGYLEGGRSVVEYKLEGLEGVGFNLLLERGLVGLVFFITFYITLLIKVFQNRHFDNPTSACCLAIIISFLLFSNMTGELSSVPPTLFLVGVLLRLLEINKQCSAIGRAVIFK